MESNDIGKKATGLGKNKTGIIAVGIIVILSLVVLKNFREKMVTDQNSLVKSQQVSQIAQHLEQKIIQLEKQNEQLTLEIRQAQQAILNLTTPAQASPDLRTQLTAEFSPIKERMQKLEEALASQLKQQDLLAEQVNLINQGFQETQNHFAELKAADQESIDRIKNMEQSLKGQVVNKSDGSLGTVVISK